MRVTGDALRWIRSGHPWVYEDSITSEADGGRPGDLAVVFDRRRRFRAIGLFDPTSPIRVRILHRGEPTPIDEDWFARRLGDVIGRRFEVFDPSVTNGWRAVAGENDGLPGLVVDRYADVAVVKIYTPAWIPLLPTIVPAAAELLDADTVLLRLSRNSEAHVPDGIDDGTALLGSVPAEPVRFRENGLTVEADVVAGQKTGWFLDQRDNRRRVRALAEGARVLDVFSAAGGFTLAAAAGGARSVMSVDISGPALDATRRNLEHNRDLPTVRACHHETRRGDAFGIMEDLAATAETFDIVIVDPPSFASNEASIAGALRAYTRLTERAIALLRDGGLLVQASCSSRVDPGAFETAVRTGAERSGAELHDLRRFGHAPDHPVGFRHGEYLKAVFARVAGRGRRR